MAMERILQRLQLGTLIDNFKQQRMDPSAVLSSSDAELARLGVSTIGDRVRLREICREEESDTQQAAVNATLERSNVASQIRNERNLLFAPGLASRSRGQTSRKTSSRRGTEWGAKQPKRPWTVSFVCLADRLAAKIPNASEKQILHSAGLGLKKIKLDMNDDEQMVQEKLCSNELKDGKTIGFPQLRDCGGFEMMVCTSNCKQLVPLESAWDAESLKSILGGGQSKIYLRPIQLSLPTKTGSEKRSKTALKEKCKMCDQEILLSELRVHFLLCNKDILDCEFEDGPIDGWVTRGESSTLSTTTLTSIAVGGGLESSSDQADTSIGTYANNLVSQTSSDQVDLTTTIEENDSDDFFSHHLQNLTDQAEITIGAQANNLNDSTIDVEIIDNADGGNSQQVDPIIISEAVYAAPDQINVDEKIAKIAEQCRENGTSGNAVEILRSLQAGLVVGRDLEISNSDQCPEGATNLIMIDRQNLLATAFEEIAGLENKHITLEVQFYGEVASDYGGPRREFFMLILREIKEKYFDLGLNETKGSDYYIVGLILGLSILQNGKIPQFLGCDVVEKIFKSATASPCLTNLRKGFKDIGICQICQELPAFLNLFQRGYQTLTFKRFTTLFKPQFSDDGSNARRFEGEVYALLLKYMKEAASGRGENITLGHVLGFATGTDEEPVLGFALHPSICFVDCESFIPTANTCINSFKIPRASFQQPLPQKEFLFNLYDLAFANSYFGLV